MQSLTSSLAAAAALVHTTLALPQKVVDDMSPGVPYDPKTSKYCSWWWNNDGSIPSLQIPEAWGITMEDFVRWNSSLGVGCRAYAVGKSYCVEAYGEPKPTTSLPPPSTTTKNPTELPTTTTAPKHTNGIETPTPIHPGMVDNCDAFYLVKSGDGCSTIAEKHGITLKELVTWNPEIGDTCSGLWKDVNVCVSVIGHTTVPTEPDNGIEIPKPTQPGMVKNCDTFYKVKSGDSCGNIAKNSGINLDEFVEWNTGVRGNDCTGLLLDFHILRLGLGHTPTPTDTGNGIETPSPIQDGMTKSCKTFHFVTSGQSCATVASRYGISVADFVRWNRP
ncbi:hypothetical protein DL765_010618 [Monosporascus sp. GIB2]|nr:hypothetical protein DL765_010618 [Monosporascus sp. GIB2]